MEAYVPVQLILNCRKENSVATVHKLFSDFGWEFELSAMLRSENSCFMPYVIKLS